MNTFAVIKLRRHGKYSWQSQARTPPWRNSCQNCRILQKVKECLVQGKQRCKFQNSQTQMSHSRPPSYSEVPLRLPNAVWLWKPIYFPYRSPKHRWCLWCNGYHHRIYTRWYEFNSWTRLIAFHIALIPLGKVWIQLFSLQLWINSRAD